MKLLFHKITECLEMHFLNFGGVLRKPLPAKIKRCKWPGTEKKTWEKRISQGGKN